MTSADEPVEPLLQIRGLRRSFGGVHALRGANLSIARGGVVHGLIGENGSGKSTLLNVLSGQLPADAGTMRFGGAEVRFADPGKALKAGIAMVSQETAVALDLSVAENVLLGRRMVRGAAGIDWGRTRRDAASVLERLGLDYDPRWLVRALRPDQRQMVEIARAISFGAKLVILDEPTSSLTDDEVRELFTALNQLKSTGVSVLFVSHRLSELFEISDEVTVLRDGMTAGSALIADWTPESLVEAMVGTSREQLTRGAGPSSARSEERPAALTASNIQIERTVHGASLRVGEGEIVGLAGLVGSGRTELMAALFGARRCGAGALEIGGEPTALGSPRRSIALGVGYVPPERKTEGVVLGMSVGKNLVMVATAPKWRLGAPRPRAEQTLATRAGAAMRLRAPSLRTAVSTLSGGNQQKVALGKWLTGSPKVLLLDEPTRGVDVAAKSEIHQRLRAVAAEGTGILLSSSENSELLGVCDRIVVMARGRVVGDVCPAGISESELVRMTGGHA